ncbi:MAG: hypothetical protein H6820_07790, partial [Phycisphaerales bacterium]|nr:hypothetical protein [Phycisphaerales bacterium]
MVSKVSFQPRIIGCICLCMLTASTALADDPPESATSKFLGAVADRGNVSFVLQQASPLFGGREYYVSGEGRIVIVDIRRQPDGEFIERRFEMADASEETDKLIAMIRQVDLLSIPLEQKDQPRRTCSTP